ncbi:MAG: pilus assembly protein PilP [Deltaproteobacteria bacterium]|nr:pilus assembly protein PilP [Deltaproteobacteria bacterium]
MHRILPLALLVAGCGSEPAPAHKGPVLPQLGALAPAPAEAPVAEPVADAGAEYVYNPIGKRDPFRTFIASIEEEDIASPTPLQRYEIEQYRLTGIVWGVDRPRALMEDPEGIGHVVELGTYVGRKWGKVTRIRSDRIVITEEYLTPDGTLVVNPIEIGLTEAGEQEGGEAR